MQFYTVFCTERSSFRSNPMSNLHAAAAAAQCSAPTLSTILPARVFDGSSSDLAVCKLKLRIVMTEATMALPVWSSHPSSRCCVSSSSSAALPARVGVRLSDSIRRGRGGSPRRGGGGVVASLKSMDQRSSGSGEAGERAEAKQLPLREIPGGYGIPYLSQWVNRWRYFFIEGVPKYWENRMAQYKSTVFRTNMPPGWPWTDSRCIVFLDQKSYPTVFDYDKVDKYKAFAGTVMPSTAYNGGLEMCAYLDPSDKKHEQLKAYCYELLKLAAPNWAQEFHTTLASGFREWELKLSQKEPALVTPTLPEFMFRFMVNVLTSANLDDPTIPVAEKPLNADMQKWFVCQLLPVVNSKLLPVVVEELLHLAPIPAKLTEGGYKKMVAFLQKYATETLGLATSHGLSPEEAVHNLIFFMIFNAHGGYSRFLPNILLQVGQFPELQADIRAEVRAAVQANGGEVTLKAVMKDMPLVTSTVFESLRFAPPVQMQCARAKKDFVVESHDARFQIKKGEFLGGVNYFVSRDPKVFKSDPDKFVATRFMGPEGEKLLPYLVWSNGRQTDENSVNRKQCPAKDIVPLTGRLLLAEIFMRYDSFTMGGPDQAMAFTSLQRRADL